MSTERTVTIPNISCGHCTAAIEEEIGELQGVTMVRANQETKQVTIAWESPTDWAKIEATLIEIDYPPATS